MIDRNVDLLEECIDLALRMGELYDVGFSGRKIAECRHLVLATREYLEREGEPRTPDELSTRQTFVISNGSERSSCQFHKDGAEMTATTSGRVRVSTGEYVRAAACGPRSRARTRVVVLARNPVGRIGGSASGLDPAADEALRGFSGGTARELQGESIRRVRGGVINNRA
jgi:hypothetical protein